MYFTICIWNGSCILELGQFIERPFTYRHKDRHTDMSKMGNFTEGHFEERYFFLSKLMSYKYLNFFLSQLMSYKY